MCSAGPYGGAGGCALQGPMVELLSGAPIVEQEDVLSRTLWWSCSTGPFGGAAQQGPIVELLRGPYSGAGGCAQQGPMVEQEDVLSRAIWWSRRMCSAGPSSPYCSYYDIVSDS